MPQDIVEIVKRKLPKGGGAVETRGERIKRMVLEAARKKFEERKEEIGGDLAAPISPSSNEIIDAVMRQLKTIGLGESPTMYDLGCGDGRWLKEWSGFGGRCVGIEVDDERIEKAKERCEGLEGVEVRKGSVFDDIEGLEEANVVIMYLFREAIEVMKKRFEGRKGVVLVSVGFSFGTGFKCSWEVDVGGIKVYMYDLR